MSRRKRGSRRGELWRGYRRPILRDGAFWLALIIGAVATAVQAPMSDFHGSAIDWTVLGGETIITFVVSFALVGLLAHTVRSFKDGYATAPAGGSRSRRATAGATSVRPGTAGSATTGSSTRSATGASSTATSSFVNNAARKAAAAAVVAKRAASAASAAATSSPTSSPTVPPAAPADPSPTASGAPAAGRPTRADVEAGIDRQARKLGRAVSVTKRMAAERAERARRAKG